MTATNGKPATFDLNAARQAAIAEAGEDTFDFRFGPDDRVFSILPGAQWPLECSARFARGDLVGAMQLVLIGGEEAWYAFEACTPTLGDINNLFEAVGAWAGVDNLPNSSAPRRRGSTRK